MKGICVKNERKLTEAERNRILKLTAVRSVFFFVGGFSFTPKSLKYSDWCLMNWQELKKTEWLLKGVIKNTFIMLIRYNTHFIPDFQHLLQAFSQCLSWRHSKPEVLAIVELFS